MPPPEPRSSTTSPSRSSATAVGLPQPRLASMAVTGSWSRSSLAYRSAPNPGSSAVAAPQQPLSQPQSAGWPQPQSPRPRSGPGPARPRRPCRSGAGSSAGSLEVEGGGQAAQGVTPQRVVGPGAALLAVQQPGLDELLEVVADGGLAQAQGPGELAHAHRLGTGGEPVEDLDPVGVGQGPEQPHGRLDLVVGEARRPQRSAAGRAGRRGVAVSACIARLPESSAYRLLALTAVDASSCHMY